LKQSRDPYAADCRRSGVQRTPALRHPLSDQLHAAERADPAAALKLVQTELPRQKDAAAIARLGLCRGRLLLSGKRESAVDDYQLVIAEAERLRTHPCWRMRWCCAASSGNDGQYADAIADLKRGFELDAQLGDVFNQNYALNAIANLYADSNVKDYEQALQYYRKLLAAHQAQARCRTRRPRISISPARWKRWNSCRPRRSVRAGAGD
jgi:tetratricopeptide (TPR) repeat protein